MDLQALETSFDLVAPRGDDLVDTFYARLFAVEPDVEPLFDGTDMNEQKTKLLATLVLLRKSLRDLGAVVPKLREIGRRHRDYGAHPEHYALVKAVLIDSMAEVAGPTWRPEYTSAWSDALDVVAETMLEGATV